MFAALLLLLPFALCARIPNSPYPVPLDGLNASTSLLIFYSDGLSNADALTLSALQGLANRRRPTLARTVRGGAAELWLNATRDLWGTPLNYSLSAAGLPALVAALAPAIPLAGYVLCSLADASANAGAAFAAARSALLVTPDNAPLAAGAGLRLLADVRGRDWAWAAAALNNSAGFAFSRSVTTLQQPAKAACCMTDYSVAYGALQWWEASAASAAAQRAWGALAPGFAALGWGPDELDTVTAASRAGGAVVASDWASNLDVLSAFDVAGLAQRRAPPPPPPPAPAHTVCFLMSDGDNVQFLLGGFATGEAWFGSPARGSVAMGWTLSAATADLAPIVPHLLYANASAVDGFVGGVSGAGYFYPDEVLAGGSDGGARLAALAALTAGAMAKADLRVLNVLARGAGVSAAAAEALLAQPQIGALLWYPFDDYSGLRGSVAWSSGGKPVIGGRFNLWGNGSDPSGPTFMNVTGMAAALLAQARDPASASGYSLVPVHAWSHSVADVAQVMALVREGGGGVEAVTPEVLVQRVVANVKRA
jgi:hypothetical protein